MGIDPDPGLDDLKSRNRIRTKIVRIRDTLFGPLLKVKKLCMYTLYSEHG
jgi:hypothetical protein